MEIALFQDDEPLRFDRVVLYPYPDFKRVWTRIWLNTLKDEKPNIEVRVFNPDGSENASVYLMAHAEQRAETTLHLRNARPGFTYHVVAELTSGLSDKPTLIERQEFDMLLEFRNPDKGEPGFGFGVDWEAVQQKAAGLKN